MLESLIETLVEYRWTRRIFIAVMIAALFVFWDHTNRFMWVVAAVILLAGLIYEFKDWRAQRSKLVSGQSDAA